MAKLNDPGSGWFSCFENFVFIFLKVKFIALSMYKLWRLLEEQHGPLSSVHSFYGVILQDRSKVKT